MIYLTCTCKRRFWVSDNQAGKKAECPKCGKFCRVPTDGGEEPSDEPPIFEEPGDIAEPVDWRKNLPSVKRKAGRCQCCDEPAKRRFAFLGAEMGDVGDVERVATGYRFTTTYKNVTRNEMVLCTSCAQAEYRKMLMPYAITWGILAIILPLISLILCLNLLPESTRTVVLILHAAVSGIFFCLLAVTGLKMMRPNLKSETMNRAVVKIARRDRPDLGPHFFTVREMKRMTGSDDP